jgi:hypothetical protein
MFIGFLHLGRSESVVSFARIVSAVLGQDAVHLAGFRSLRAFETVHRQDIDRPSCQAGNTGRGMGQWSAHQPQE